jgi:hypothetical protein
VSVLIVVIYNKCVHVQEQLTKLEEYEIIKSELLQFFECTSERLSYTPDVTSRISSRPVNMADLIHEHLASTQQLLESVEFQKAKIDRLQHLGNLASDMSSEKRRSVFLSEMKTVTGSYELLLSTLTSRNTKLSELDLNWSYMSSQSSELMALLTETQNTLRQAVEDDSLTPQQQYEIIKVI